MESAENGRKKGFKYWFVNIFWYHYGLISIVALFLLVTAVWFTVEAIRKDEYDLNVAVILDHGVSRDDLGELYALLGEAAGDVDGDGKALVNIVPVDLSDQENPVGARNQMMLYLSLPEYTLFFMNEGESRLYAGQEDTFQELKDYGIETADETGKRIEVGKKEVLAPLGGGEIYLCLADWTVSGKGDARMTAAAVRAIKALLESPEAPETSET